LRVDAGEKSERESVKQVIVGRADAVESRENASMVWPALS
jgi:hypothetical protein